MKCNGKGIFIQSVGTKTSISISQCSQRVWKMEIISTNTMVGTFYLLSTTTYQIDSANETGMRKACGTLLSFCSENNVPFCSVSERSKEACVERKVG
jgi:hypothetical protein